MTNRFDAFDVHLRVAEMAEGFCSIFPPGLKLQFQGEVSKKCMDTCKKATVFLGGMEVEGLQ